MPRSFITLFFLSTFFGALSYIALRALLAGGGLGAAALLVLFGLPAAAGVAVLVRTAYLDGLGDRNRVSQARQLRRRL